MYCTNCGSQISDNAVVCPHCGVQVGPLQPSAPTPPSAPVPQNRVYAPAPYVQQRQPENTIAIVGFVLSFLIPLAGLICSIVGYNKVKKEGAANGGLAIAGIVISAISLGMILLTVLIYFFLLMIIFSAVATYPPAVSALLLL